MVPVQTMGNVIFFLANGGSAAPCFMHSILMAYRHYIL